MGSKQSKSNIPPDHLWELPQENARRENHILPTYENLMAIHGERLANLNITLCQECFIAIKIEEGEFCNKHKP